VLDTVSLIDLTRGDLLTAGTLPSLAPTTPSIWSSRCGSAPTRCSPTTLSWRMLLQ